MGQRHCWEQKHEMSSAVERLDSFTLCLHYTSPALKIFSFLSYSILLHYIVIHYISLYLKSRLKNVVQNVFRISHLSILWQTKRYDIFLFFFTPLLHLGASSHPFLWESVSVCWHRCIASAIWVKQRAVMIFGKQQLIYETSDASWKLADTPEEDI